MTRGGWLAWLRTCSRDTQSPGHFDRHLLGALTGQDTRALSAIAACWELYACSDAVGQAGALAAIRSLVPAMQPSTRWFARALIAHSLDWPDRDRLWPLVDGSRERLSIVPRKG